MAGHRSALVVATSTYEDSRLTRLEAPAQDARTLEQVLKDPDVGGFDVIVLEDAPKHTIEQDLEAFFDKRAREDLLLLYFSGHGITTVAPQRSYFFATRTTRTDRLRSTAISAGYVNDLMRSSRARQKVLFVDCCHGGAFKWDMVKAGASAGVLESFQGENTPGTGMAVITASQATQYALQGESIEGSPVQSIFTSVLVEGLKTGAADVNSDGHVSLDELYDYLREKATTESQAPELNVVGGTGQILIARNPHPEIQPAELSTELQQDLRSDLWWQRKGAVDALASYLEMGTPDLALSARLTLERMVEDPDHRVSSHAASALAEVPDIGVSAWIEGRSEHEAKAQAEQEAKEAKQREEQEDKAQAKARAEQEAKEAKDGEDQEAKTPEEPEHKVLIGAGIAAVLVALLIGILIANRDDADPAAGGTENTDRTPAPDGGNQSIAFVDDFSSTEFGWDDAGDTGIGGHYEGGAYQISAERGGEGGSVFASPSAASTAADLRVKVDARRIGGTSSEGYGYGMFCRADGLGNLYAFTIWAKHANISKRIDGRSFDLGDSNPAVTSAVQGDTERELQAVCATVEGQRAVDLQFWVNGELILSRRDGDNPHEDGTFGLHAMLGRRGGTSGDTLEVEYDNFEVRAE